MKMKSPLINMLKTRALFVGEDRVWTAGRKLLYRNIILARTELNGLMKWDLVDLVGLMVQSEL